MATIIPFLQDGAFDQPAIQAMSMALDDVCKSLGVPAHNQSAKEVIAARIIELARRGERNPTRLRDRVLHEAGNGNGAG